MVRLQIGSADERSSYQYSSLVLKWQECHTFYRARRIQFEYVYYSTAKQFERCDNLDRRISV